MSDKCANEHVLSEYYGTPPDAKDALKEGVRKILGEKGGFLCIPADTTTNGFVPRNHAGSQALNANRTAFDSVTVADPRHGVERRYLPPVGDGNSELTTFAGHILERDLRVDLGWQGSYAVESLCSRMAGGGSSASMQLAEETKKDETRFYVPTLMGLFPGQKLKIDLLEALFTVVHLGLDAQGLFVETAEKAPRDIPKAAPLYNKHNVGVLALSDTSNTDNQGSSLGISRRAYGAGDLFLMTGILEYQSNVFSGLGDEGGVGCAIDLLHDLECFHGEVESWTQVAGRETAVVYKPTGDAPATRNSQKLGTSRPLINLRRDKWKFDGVANVIAPNLDPKDWIAGLKSPGHLAGCILLRAKDRPADWQKLVGSFITLLGRPGSPDTIDNTDASEYYKRDAGDVHRWWLITEVQEDTGIEAVYVFVDRPIQRTHEVVKAGPRLFRDVNVTTGKAEVDAHALRYVIAPGAWISDVRQGVAGNVLGNEGAQPSDPRRILLAPGEPALEKGDPITNPPGPDVWHPSGFRVRHLHSFPAFGTGTGFASENLGRVQVGSGLHVGGAVNPNDGESMADALKRVQKDQRPLYANGVLITAPTDTAIRIEGYTERGAMELFQTHSEQAIVWWNPTATDRSSLRRDPTTGDFVFSAFIGPDDVTATLTGPKGIALTNVKGLSSTKTAARNLCGRATVKSTEHAATVKLPRTEADADYRVFIQCSWLTQSAVVKRSADQFDVTFSVPAPEDTGFDWMVMR